MNENSNVDFLIDFYSEQKIGNNFIKIASFLEDLYGRKKKWLLKRFKQIHKFKILAAIEYVVLTNSLQYIRYEASFITAASTDNLLSNLEHHHLLQKALLRSLEVIGETTKHRLCATASYLQMRHDHCSILSLLKTSRINRFFCFAIPKFFINRKSGVLKHYTASVLIII